MKRTVLFALLLAGLVFVGMLLWNAALRQSLIERVPTTWGIRLSALRHGLSVDHDVRIAMPDGVELAASLYLPRDGAGPWPTILVRLPYHRLRYGEGYNSGLFFARHGYAVLVQDLRGTGDSEGELHPWQHAEEDGVATLDWISRQPWSTGKVGTFGCSALGETQLILSRRNHPAHAAMIPSGAGGAVGSIAGRHGFFGLFEGGVFQLASGFGWFVESGSRLPGAPPAGAFDYPSALRRLPLDSLVDLVRPVPNAFADFVTTPLNDPRWRAWGFLAEGDISRVPALVINTWGDQTVGDSLALAEHWRLKNPDQKVVIGPGTHCHHEEVGDTVSKFGELELINAGQPWKDWYLRWFEYWLQGNGNGLSELPAYTYFMLGENKWLHSGAWPPRDVSWRRLYLDSHGHANGASGDGRLNWEPPAGGEADSYRYDPGDPVPTRGGPLCCTGNPEDRAGPADQRDVEARSDVLVYTSQPLDHDLRIAGPLAAQITMSSSALDTDLVVRLVDVEPDGRSLGVQEGALRLRYRDGMDRPRLLVPGEAVSVRVDMRSIAYRFAKGHRVRLHVTSSSFPRLERNLNTGAQLTARDTHMAVAMNRVHHDQNLLSYVELPFLGVAP